MGLGFFKRLFGGAEEKQHTSISDVLNKTPAPQQKPETGSKRKTLLPKSCIKKYYHKPSVSNRTAPEKPYSLARHRPCGFLDGRVDEKAERLTRYGLPILQTPEDLSKWLKIPLKTLAWLSDYHRTAQHEKIEKKWQYRYQWIPKRSGSGWRLLEIPKPMLKHVQRQILQQVLNKFPAHAAAHGFTKGRSILTNAQQHSGKHVILKADLQDFYPSIDFRRVKSIFRGMGYNIEISWYLARLCTTRMNQHAPKPNADAKNVWRITYAQMPYRELHLPQGAPTSPALANLSAWALDVRLSGLAKKFNVTYTRYADDLTFSGDEKFMRGKSVNVLIRYIKGIIINEKFQKNHDKLKIARQGNRQIVTGLTVNAKPNIKREDFDRLKAILHNCVKKGASSQNLKKVENFQAHLQGRIAFMKSINPQKSAKLEKLFESITQW